MQGNAGMQISGYEYINGLRATKSEKDLFRRIYIAYSNCFYMGGIKDTHTWKMNLEMGTYNFGDRLKFSARLNILALILGPLFYILKKMYIKGLILAAIAFVFFLIPSAKPLIPLIWIYSSLCADIDYFKVKFLESKNIQNDLGSLSNNYSASDFQKYIKKGNLIPYLKLLIIILFTGAILYSAVDGTIKANSEKYFFDIEKVCKDRSSCIEMSEKLNSKIAPNPEAAEASTLYKMGCIQYALNNKESAYQYLNRAAYKKSGDVKILSATAQVASETGQYDNAIKIYSHILKLYPGMHFVNYYIGKVYYKAKDYNHALQAFEITTKYYPNEPTYYESKAYAKIYTKDKQGAIEDIRTAIKLLKRTNKNNQNKTKIENLENYLLLLM